jgi:hypothetical protein
LYGPDASVQYNGWEKGKSACWLKIAEIQRAFNGSFFSSVVAHFFSRVQQKIAFDQGVVLDYNIHR